MKTPSPKNNNGSPKVSTAHHRSNGKPTEKEIRRLASMIYLDRKRRLKHKVL